MKFKLSLMTFMFCMFAILNLSAQSIPLVYDVENSGANCDTPDLPDPSELLPVTTLPDPFAWSDGSGRSTDFADWECRRNEIKDEVEHYELGLIPERPSDISATFEGTTLTVNVTVNGETLTLESEVSIPDGDGPFPVMVGMNNGTGSLPGELFDGLIQIGYRPGQVCQNNNNYNPGDPYYRLYPELADDKIGHYSAWQWGFSRLLDGIDIVKDQIKADMSHIGATGCSWQGKMALFAGAFDERVALTIIQESGGGGINSWRVSYDMVEVRGQEDVEKINNTNYSWFKDDLRNNFNGPAVSTLPYDHHEILAMIAPRAALVLGNPPFVWLADESGYISSKAAEEVYNIFGISDRFGYSFRDGHNHCQLPQDSYPEVTAFVDKFLRGDTTANTDIHYQAPVLDNIDYNVWIDPWKTPADPNAPQPKITSPESGISYDEPASYTIEVSVVDSNDNVSLVEFFNGNEKVGEATEAPYSLTLTDVPAGNYYYSVVATDAEGLIGNSNIINVKVIAATAIAYKVSTPPTIDGNIDDIWKHEKVSVFQARNQVQGAGQEDDDLSGYAKVVWDENNVYLLADINDEIKINDGPAIYQDDNVEFYFDINNAKASSYDDDDCQLTFRWNDGENIGLIGTISTDAMSYVIKDKDNGYVLEAVLPWSSLGGTVADGQEIGFDFMINDDDDGGNRDGKLSWIATADDSWQNASLFGTLKLLGETITNTEELDANSFSVFPNPAHNRLQVDGFNTDFNYKVIDITGKLMLKGTSRNSINIGSLSNGVYLLNIRQDNKETNVKFVKQ